MAQWLKAFVPPTGELEGTGSPGPVAEEDTKLPKFVFFPPHMHCDTHTLNLHTQERICLNPDFCITLTVPTLSLPLLGRDDHIPFHQHSL